MTSLKGNHILFTYIRQCILISPPSVTFIPYYFFRPCDTLSTTHKTRAIKTEKTMLNNPF